MRRISPLVLAGLFAAAGTVAAAGQLATDYNPPKSTCCLPGAATTLATSAATLADELQDWNQLGRFHADDEALMKQPADPNRVVFMGDSITDFWRLEDSFPGKPYVNRGISGQTTSQMLVRMYPDVIDLKPAAVIILAGTNDIARNTGPETIEMIEENLMAMTELAQGHNIKVVLSALTPINDNPMPPGGTGRAGAGPGAAPAGGRAGAPPRRKQSEQRPPTDILALNTWMKGYAAKAHAVYADYYTATVDSDGFFKSGYTNDGLHPNTQGYTLMAPVAAAALAQVVR